MNLWRERYEMKLPLKMFHDGSAPLANGLRRDNILLMSDTEFESNHGFIQWAFPTNLKSRSLSTAPVLDAASAITLSSSQDVVEFLEKMAVRFLEFLKRNDHWIVPYNHNHARISRAITSLRLLHSCELASWFYQEVIRLAGADFDKMHKSNKFWSSYASPLSDQIAGCFVGLAIGDALGAPVEFCRRGTFAEVTAYREGGKFNLPSGAWTDDTAMALCLADSLIKNDGLNTNDLLEGFCEWASDGVNTSTGVAVGIGQNTLRTLGSYKRDGSLEAKAFGSKNDGNGSIMRLAAVPCRYAHDIEGGNTVARGQSKTTHASTLAQECSHYLSELITHLFQGRTLDEARYILSKQTWSDPATHALLIELKGLDATAIRSSGYVIDTLQAAIWAVQTTQSFEAAVIKAVNLGDDADTVGAVTGQIAGAMYGYSKVPKALKEGLIDERKLYVTSQFLCVPRVEG